MSADLNTLQAALGYTFNDPSLLKQALTHSSAASKRVKSNERMEFLGDRVLGLVLAEMLLEAFPKEDEGGIGYRFTALAQRDALARVAGEVGLADQLKLSNGEHMMGGRENPGVLADAVEAVLAAIYLDGGLAAAQTFVRAHWTQIMREDKRPPKDPKTRLQEWAQGRGLGLPTYTITGQSGPDHQPEFDVDVELAGAGNASGSGQNKRAAEQAAAVALIEKLEQKARD
jgi:ribonuclease-3